MIAFRDRRAAETAVDLRVHINPEGVAQDIGPISHGAAVHTDVMKTQGLKQALEQGGFDAAIGGARRDEEIARQGARVLVPQCTPSLGPEESAPGAVESLQRAHQTWRKRARVSAVQLDRAGYLAVHLPRTHSGGAVVLRRAAPVVQRDGAWIMVDDDRLPLHPGETPQLRSVRFRTLGCYPLTGAIESTADTLEAVIAEMLVSTSSERQGRMIDHAPGASMEQKKLEGYF